MEMKNRKARSKAKSKNRADIMVDRLWQEHLALCVKCKSWVKAAKKVKK